MRIVLLSLYKVKFCINQKLLFILKHTLKLVHYTVAEMYAKPFCTLRMRINQNNNNNRDSKSSWDRVQLRKGYILKIFNLGKPC